MSENFLPYIFGNERLSGNPSELPYVQVITLNDHRLSTILKHLGDKTVIINRPELRRSVAEVLSGKHPSLRVWRVTIHADRAVFEIVNTEVQLGTVSYGRVTILNPRKLELGMSLILPSSKHTIKTLLYGAANSPAGDVTSLCVWSEDTNSIQKYEYYSNTGQLALYMLFDRF